MSTFRTISPADGSVYCERPFATPETVDLVLHAASRAQRSLRGMSLEQRVAAVGRFVDAVLSKRDAYAQELTAQMGRPIRYSPGEFRGFEERARTMLTLAPAALSDVSLPKEGFTRAIRREPLGVILVLAPWNYPWLTSVNVIVPALLAGNAVVVKHSEQTPLVAERYEEAAKAAGLPEGAVAALHASHALVPRIVRDPRVAYVAFTGSVEGGHAVVAAASETFTGVGLELGGKDPAYVCEDANLDFAVENVVDGALFNSGQSCCAVERIYVHETLYDAFVEKTVALVKTYTLGDPRDEKTTLGPVVRTSNAERIVAQVQAAVRHGARSLVDAKHFGDRPLPYLAPSVLVDVTHEMDVMREETFGPVAPIMKVKDDAQAVALMNDSRYGLTASIWTRDIERAARIGDAVHTGTVFANRCDYLDPELPWVGIKDSGRGCTLSRLGFEHLTRPKSFHLRHPA